MHEPDGDRLASAHEQAKSWSAGSLAVMLVGFVLNLHLVTGIGLLGLIIFVARWIQLSQRLHQRDDDYADEDRDPGDAEDEDVAADPGDLEDPENQAPTPRSNIIVFRRPDDPRR